MAEMDTEQAQISRGGGASGVCRRRHQLPRDIEQRGEKNTTSSEGGPGFAERQRPAHQQVAVNDGK
jgi:hypothetical protein